MAIYLEELKNLKPVRCGNSSDLEQFADILDTTIINLEGNGNYGELGDGSLYLRLQKKFTEIMLRQCQRWVYQQKITICRKTEGVDNNAVKISIGGS